MRIFVALLLLPALAGCLGTSAPAPDVTYEAIVFETTAGPFTAILYPDAAPETVALYKAYVAEGYFEGRSFGRVIPGFVIQVTDRLGGATEDERRVPLEPHPEHHFSAGALGIARGAEPGSGGPEFFVMDFATGHLDGNYTVFGQVVEGMDGVRTAARVDAAAWPSLPGAGPLLFDRWAIVPVEITATTLTEVTLPGDVAARYPLRVAANVQDDTYRHTMDWDADLAPGHGGQVTWYVRALDGEAPVPDVADVRIHIEGATLPVEGDAVASGVYRFHWTPPSAGEFEATLHADGSAWATMVVRVAGS